MIGNSTMADKPYKDGNPEKGWGQILPLYFKEGIKIENHAVNGRSTKSFLDEGRWISVYDKIKPGDYVIIEFGHNDTKKEDPKRFADANTDYRKNLEKFITETLQKGGIPILATPIVRRRFDENGKFYDVHGDYPKVIRELAVEKKVILLDLHKSSEELLINYGEENSKKLFLHISPNEYNSLPEGKTDDTHFSPTGAFRICDLASAEIRIKIPALAKFLKD
ncbi:MAG: rhamnogalacturonan acetylesterase [Ignavibacteriales bacterium]|nr:MAG: rhamnogalacturonan acetylesterase [Ignavibacteriales bacterium]